MDRMAIGECEAGLRKLYDTVTHEAIPADMAALLAKMGGGEPGAMGGKAPGSLPFAGGELAAR